MATSSSGIRERYEAEQRNRRIQNSEPQRPINRKNGKQRDGRYDERYDDRYDDRYDSRYDDRIPDRGGSRFSNSPQRSQVITLNRLVIEWWFMDNTIEVEERGRKVVKKEPILIPIFTDMYYSDKFGGRANLQHWNEWKSTNLPLRIDGIDYNGKVYKRTDKVTREVSERADLAHNQMLEAVIDFWFTPKPDPKKVKHYARGFFLASFLINLVLILHTIGVF
jgi:hypothetical protein